MKVGDQVPKIEVPSTSGQNFDLSAGKGQRLVLYFYPKDATPGCTLEGHQFNALREQFAQVNAVILGVSKDSLKAHDKFRTKECFEFALLSDEKGELCDALGVMKEKNMYGRKYWGIERSTFVVDSSGKLAHEWRGVKPDGHAAEVLNWLKINSN